MMKLFQKWRDRKAAEIQKRKLRLEQSKKEAHAELDMVTRKMLLSPCAINKMFPCNARCVHWREGRVSFYPGWEDFDSIYYAVRPVCRLWGDK